jgi:hypothetical protein
MTQVPEHCIKCGTPLEGRRSHAFLICFAAEIGIWLLLLALLVPNWPARIVFAVAAVAALFYSFAPQKERRAGVCSICNAEHAHASNRASLTDDKSPE